MLSVTLLSLIRLQVVEISMGLKKEEPIDHRTKLTSFNEGIEVMFDVGEHTYHYGNKQFKSATTWIKKFESAFNSEQISAMCSKKWDIEQDEILTLWDSNGNAAAGFGTAIHAVLEHYFTHKKLGKQIQDIAGKPKNAAMPNHPFLQELIKGLEKVRVDGDAHQEAFISSKKYGVCGLVDDLFIVDRKKKICRIRDYKITYDILTDKTDLADPFSYLGGSKLSKNYLQLCFYGYLMMMSGWKIEGIDIYNWDGSWHIYTLEGPVLMKTLLLVGSELERK